MGRAAEPGDRHGGVRTAAAADDRGILGAMLFRVDGHLVQQEDEIDHGDTGDEDCGHRDRMLEALARGTGDGATIASLI
jgi:hypothetical protein